MIDFDQLPSAAELGIDLERFREEDEADRSGRFTRDDRRHAGIERVLALAEVLAVKRCPFTALDAHRDLVESGYPCCKRTVVRGLLTLARLGLVDRTIEEGVSRWFWIPGASVAFAHRERPTRQTADSA